MLDEGGVEAHRVFFDGPIAADGGDFDAHGGVDGVEFRVLEAAFVLASFFVIKLHRAVHLHRRGIVIGVEEKIGIAGLDDVIRIGEMIPWAHGFMVVGDFLGDRDFFCFDGDGDRHGFGLSFVDVFDIEILVVCRQGDPVFVGCAFGSDDFGG